MCMVPFKRDARRAVGISATGLRKPSRNSDWAIKPSRVGFAKICGFFLTTDRKIISQNFAKITPFYMRVNALFIENNKLYILRIAKYLLHGFTSIMRPPFRAARMAKGRGRFGPFQNDRPTCRPIFTASIRGTLFRRGWFTTQISRFWHGSTNTRRWAKKTIRNRRTRRTTRTNAKREGPQPTPTNKQQRGETKSPHTPRRTNAEHPTRRRKTTKRKPTLRQTKPPLRGPTKTNTERDPKTRPSETIANAERTKKRHKKTKPQPIPRPLQEAHVSIDWGASHPPAGTSKSRCV